MRKVSMKLKGKAIGAWGFVRTIIPYNLLYVIDRELLFLERSFVYIKLFETQTLMTTSGIGVLLKELIYIKQTKYVQ